MTKVFEKKRIGLISAAAVIVLFAILPAMGELSAKAVSAIGIFLGALILWITEALPMSVTTMLMICLMALEGLMPFNEAVSNINTGTALFIMASSGMTVTMSRSTLPQRMTAGLLKRFRGHTGLLVIGLGLLVTVCSAFMSSLATCTLFACLIDTMLREKKSSMRRCMMLIIPACAGIGGFMTPAGTPANILMLDLLEQNGHSVSFAQWSMIGFPLGILASLIFIVSALLIIRPELNEDTVMACDGSVLDNKRDALTGIILLLTVIGWFASSWIGGIGITEIAVIALVVMFLPSVALLDWKTFSDGVNWDLVITMGTVSVLMTGISRTGLIEHLAAWMIAPMSNLPAFVMLCLLSIAICLLRSLIPTTTAVVTLLGPMLITIAGITGQNVAVLLMILSFWTASALLLVYTEPIFLITWKDRDYSAGDLMKVGGGPSLILAVLISAVIPLLIRLAGI